MRAVVLSKAARRDLDEIFDYIHKDNPKRAASFADELYERCRKIGEFPYAARAEQLKHGEIRLLPYRNYLIIYRVEANCVRIERIWHGARNISALIAEYFKEDD